jgi:transposase
MITIPVNTKVYLSPGNTDMRKSINTLSILVDQSLAKNPFSGNLYVFCNRHKNIIKILYWDRNGFALWQKRLEKARFYWPETVKEAEEISFRELGWLLEGIDIREIKAHEALNYSILY